MRKQYDATFKARVALDAIRSKHTISELAAKYEIHPNQIGKWRKAAIEGLSEIFSKKRVKKDNSAAELQDRLYQEIDQLKVELDWLKKKSAVFE